MDNGNVFVFLAVMGMTSEAGKNQYVIFLEE